MGLACSLTRLPARTTPSSGALRPDLILITHPHGDHFQPAILQAYIQANPNVVLAGPADVAALAQENGVQGMKGVAPGKTYTMAGVTFETLPAYFEDADHHPKANGWVGYVLQLNGARYYVTGDTQPLPEMAAAKATAVFPLLYGCGGNTDAALKMVKLSGAVVVVPVHHSNQTQTVEAFMSRLPEGMASDYVVDGRFTQPQAGAMAEVAAQD